jgi:hypothetical protein
MGMFFDHRILQSCGNAFQPAGLFIEPFQRLQFFPAAELGFLNGGFEHPTAPKD